MAPNTGEKVVFNPNESLAIPKWITEDYFEEIVAKDVPDFRKIIKFTPVAATAPGENYTSIMIRVLLEIELKDGSRQSKSYILKTAFESGDGAAIVNSMNLFPKEKLMYGTYLPKFEQLYRDAGCDINLSPKCVHIEELPERITLVLEDLRVRRFGNIDRLKGMDLQHMTRSLQKLAELHAASARYQELNGPFEEVFHQSFFNENNRKMYEVLYEARIPTFQRAMRQWHLDDPEYFISKTRSHDEIFDEGLRLNKADPNEFNVLNHGDYWSNNIMFNYRENGDIDEVCPVDYQISKWGTPTQDLWYTICTSAALDIQIKEFDHFVSIYHKKLVECLKILRYSKPIPSLRELHMLMMKHGSWGPMTANGVLAAILLPSDKDANIDMMMKMGPEGDEFRYKTFTSPYFVKAVSQLYPFFDNKGIFDF